MWVKNTNDSASDSRATLIFINTNKSLDTDDDNDDKWHPSIANKEKNWLWMIRTDKMRDGEKEQPNQKKCSKFFRSSMVNFAFIVITLIYFLISLSLALLLFSQTFSSSQLNVWNQRPCSIPQMIHNVLLLYCLASNTLAIVILVFIHKNFTRHLQIVSSFGQHNGTTKWHEWFYIYCDDRSKELHSWKIQSNFICANLFIKLYSRVCVLSTQREREKKWNKKKNWSNFTETDWQRSWRTAKKLAFF